MHGRFTYVVPPARGPRRALRKWRQVCFSDSPRLVRRPTIYRMADTTLYQFIDTNRDELITRCRAKVAKRSAPPPTKRRSITEYLCS